MQILSVSPDYGIQTHCREQEMAGLQEIPAGLSMTVDVSQTFGLIW